MIENEKRNLEATLASLPLAGSVIHRLRWPARYCLWTPAVQHTGTGQQRGWKFDFVAQVNPMLTAVFSRNTDRNCAEIPLKDSRARCGWLEVGVIMARLWIIRRDTRRRLWQMNKQAARRSLITLHFTGLPCCGCWCLFNCCPLVLPVPADHFDQWELEWRMLFERHPHKTQSNWIGSYFDRISLKLFFVKEREIFITD